MPTTFLFDLDDTLYLEREYVASGFRAVAAVLDGRGIAHGGEFFDYMWSLFESGVRERTFDRWAVDTGVNPALVPELVHIYRNHDPQIRLAHGALDLLAAARRLGPTGVVTDGLLACQQAKVKALGLDELVDVVVFSDTWGREHWKPSPRPFLEALERCQALAGNAVYVGDNPAKDFTGARALGMRTIRVRHEYGLHVGVEPLTPADAPDVEVRNLTEVVDALHN